MASTAVGGSKFPQYSLVRSGVAAACGGPGDPGEQSYTFAEPSTIPFEDADAIDRCPSPPPPPRGGGPGGAGGGGTVQVLASQRVVANPPTTHQAPPPESQDDRPPHQTFIFASKMKTLRKKFTHPSQVLAPSPFFLLETQSFRFKLSLAINFDKGEPKPKALVFL